MTCHDSEITADDVKFVFDLRMSNLLTEYLIFNNRILSLLEVSDKESIQQARLELEKNREKLNEKLENYLYTCGALVKDET